MEAAEVDPVKFAARCCSRYGETCAVPAVWGCGMVPLRGVGASWVDHDCCCCWVGGLR